MTSLLLHICCAPCGIYPIRILKEKLFKIGGYFDNPNIHPFTEYEKRKEYVLKLGYDENIDIDYSTEYDMENFFRKVAYRESERCFHCYTMRLGRAAMFAKNKGFDGFSTTLLYSKYQNHEMIVKIAQEAAQDAGVSFYYEDFRLGWRDGINESKARKYYRQQYCGCVYSEKERYSKNK